MCVYPYHVSYEEEWLGNSLSGLSREMRCKRLISDVMSESARVGDPCETYPEREWAKGDDDRLRYYIRLL